MEKWTQLPSIDDVNKVDMVGYLSSLGILPVSISGNEVRYFSPLKKEHFPTFVVFRDTNTWTEGEDCSRHPLMDFATAISVCTIGELLQQFAGYIEREAAAGVGEFAEDQRFQVSIVSKRLLESSELYLYLRNLGIPWGCAKHECLEAEVRHLGRVEKAIAFPNDLGGYELRNSGLDHHYGPTGRTYLYRGAPTCCVFQDVIDMLSFKALFWDSQWSQTNILTLNDAKYPCDAMHILAQQKSVQLYLPRTPEGRSLADQIVRSFAHIKDRSQLYAGHHSLNEWVRNFGKARSPDEQKTIGLKRTG